MRVLGGSWACGCQALPLHLLKPETSAPGESQACIPITPPGGSHGLCLEAEEPSRREGGWRVPHSFGALGMAGPKASHSPKSKNCLIESGDGEKRE